METLISIPRSAPSGRFRFENLHTTPEYERVAAGVRARDWPAIEAALRALPDHDVSGAFDGFRHLRDRKLQPVLEAASSSPYAPTVAAFHMTGIRQFNNEVRYKWAVRSERELFAVVSEHPNFRPARIGRILLGRLIGLDRSELLRRFDDLQAVEFDDFYGTSIYFQSQLPKWGGTPSSALDFVRRRAVEVSASSLTPYLIAAAHLELSFESRSAGYFDNDVVSELLEASHRPAFQPRGTLTPAEVIAHNVFAAAFVKADRPADAARHFEIIGPRGSWLFWWTVPGASRPSGVVRKRRAVFRRVKLMASDR